METMMMSAAELDSERKEELRVHEWRVEQLQRLGVPRTLAFAFAGLVDWHEIAALIEHGCSPELAIEIVR
jgi:hypothetical protein